MVFSNGTYPVMTSGCIWQLNIAIMTLFWLREQCVAQTAPGCQNHQQGEVMAKSVQAQKTYVTSYTCCYYSDWRLHHIETLQPPATSPSNLISLENGVGSYSGVKKSFGNVAVRHPREKWSYLSVQGRFAGAGAGWVTFPRTSSSWPALLCTQGSWVQCSPLHRQHLNAGTSIIGKSYSMGEI